MKILFYIESLQAGGKERRFFELLKYLNQFNEIIFEIITSKSDIHYTGIFELSSNIHFIKRNSILDIKFISSVFKVIKRFKPDIFHCWDNVAAYHISPIAKFENIRFINSFISTSPSSLPIWSKNYLSTAISFPFSDRILSNSVSGLHAYRVPKKKSKCIYNGFDIARCNNFVSEKEVRNRLGIKSKYIVGMVASFSPQKDYDTFITAAKKILNKRNDVSFVTVGSGVNLSKIKQLTSNHEEIHFLGKQSDIESLVNIFTIGVLATYTEGISNSIMEYMAMGKPVIATNGGGTSEIVKEGISGILIEPENAQMLADKIEFLLNSPDTCYAMGKAGKKIITNEFTINKMGNEFIELYKEAIYESK